MTKINKRMGFQHQHYRRCLEVLTRNQGQATMEVEKLDKVVGENRQEVREVERRMEEKVAAVRRLEAAVESLRTGGGRGRSPPSHRDGDGRQGRGGLPWSQGSKHRAGAGQAFQGPIF